MIRATIAKPGMPASEPIPESHCLTSKIDLQERLNQLRQTVSTTTARRKQEAELASAEQRQQKAKDWAQVVQQAPELADSIKAISTAFGKPELLIVQIDGQTVIDSRNYDPLYDKARFRAKT